MSLVFKILTEFQWEAAREAGVFKGSPADLADAYIHLSGPEQVAETARRHFSGQSGLWLLSFETERLGGTLKWEPSRGGELFPHLYGPLSLDAMVEALPLALDPDGVPLAAR